MTHPGEAPVRTVRIIARLNVGGPARHVVLLDDGLRARGYQPLLVYGALDDGEASLEHLAADAGLATLQIATLGRRVSPAGDVVALTRIAKTLFQVRPDIVHTHTAKAGTLGRLAAAGYNLTRRRSRRCAVLHTFHGHVLSGYFGPMLSRAVIWIERLLALATDCVVTISESQRRDIVEVFRVANRDRVAVVPLGLDLSGLLSLSADHQTLRAALAIPNDALVFGFVGRLVPIKDIPTLIRAFAEVAATSPSVYLLVAGDGPLKVDIERLIDALGLASRVRLIGWTSDLPELYATIDVGVLSSRNEGTPVAILESMAAAKPVIATRVGGVVDLVRDGYTGLLVPAAEPQRLAAAMRALAEDPATRRTMGSKGREIACTYTREALVERMSSLYDAVLSRKRLSRRQRLA